MYYEHSAKDMTTVMHYVHSAKDMTTVMHYVHSAKDIVMYYVHSAKDMTTVMHYVHSAKDVTTVMHYVHSAKDIVMYYVHSAKDMTTVMYYVHSAKNTTTQSCIMCTQPRTRPQPCIMCTQPRTQSRIMRIQPTTWPHRHVPTHMVVYLNGINTAPMKLLYIRRFMALSFVTLLLFSFPICLLSCEMQPRFNLNITVQLVLTYGCFLVTGHNYCFVRCNCVT